MRILQKTSLLFFASACCVLSLYAQKKAAADSSENKKNDSSQQIAEAYLIRQKEQQRVDSVIAIRLQQELGTAATDSKRRKALEDSLQQLTAKDSVRKAEQQSRINELKHKATAHPVMLLTDTLFSIYTRIGSFSAAERADAISRRIKNLYDDAFFNPDSLLIVRNEVTYDIVYENDNIIMSVTDLDALWYNESADKIASVYLAKIKNGIRVEKQENSIWSWLTRIGYIALIIFGIWLIIHGINRLFRRISSTLKAHKDRYFKGFSIRKVQVLTADQHYYFAMRINNIFRLVIIVLAFYLALPLFFGVFPQTKSFATVLWRWIITPATAIFDSILHFLPNLFTIIVIYIATRYLIKIVKYFAIEIDKENIRLNGFYKEWARPTYNIVKFLIYAFMFIIIFPYLPGFQSDAFKGVSVFLGVLISLGSSSAISNLIAGLVITYMRPFKKGDRVKIGDVVGDVIEKTMLVTRIRTIKNEDITVPNSTILSSHTINYSANAQETGLIVHTTVTIGYDVPWKEVHQALIDAALQTECILQQPLPFVMQTSLDDFYVSYQLNAYTKDANKQAVIYSHLHQNIQDTCNGRGIEIMSPHYRSMRDGNPSTIPPAHDSTNGKAEASFGITAKQKTSDT